MNNLAKLGLEVVDECCRVLNIEILNGQVQALALVRTSESIVEFQFHAGQSDVIESGWRREAVPSISIFSHAIQEALETFDDSIQAMHLVSRVNGQVCQWELLELEFLKSDEGRVVLILNLHEDDYDCIRLADLIAQSLFVA